MNKTLQKCLTLKEDANTFRQKTSDTEREYEKEIITLAGEYGYIEKNLESFLEKNSILRAIYEHEIGKNKQGVYIREMKPWILLGDLMNEQINLINAHAGCKANVHYAHWESDSECGQARIEKGIILRAGLERPNWFPPEKNGFPELTVLLDNGKEEQYGMTLILTCYPGIYERSHTSGLTIFDKKSNPLYFPNKKMFETERVASEALKIYERRHEEK